MPVGQRRSFRGFSRTWRSNRFRPARSNGCGHFRNSLAQIALAYLALWVRRWFADAEAGRRRLMETNLRMALKTFHRLGYLRGA